MHSGGAGAAEDPVDMASVLALGYGPISAEKLSELVESGAVEKYADGGVWRFRRRPRGGDYKSDRNSGLPRRGRPRRGRRLLRRIRAHRPGAGRVGAHADPAPGNEGTEGQSPPVPERNKGQL